MALSQVLYRYKLSVEELVLILYTINCGKTAETLLAQAYDKIPEEHLSILLTAGRNSLLAHDYAQLADKDFPQVTKELQKTVFPLSVFTTLIELYDERPEGKLFLQLFHHPKYGFTLQQNQNHVVFNLTYSFAPQILGTFLADLYNHVGGVQGGDPLDEKTLNFSIEELLGWRGGEKEDIQAALIAKSLPEAQAEMLSTDLADMIGFGSISISPLDFEAYIKTEIYPVTKMILYVEGESNTWVFEYDDKLDKPHLARRVSMKDLQDYLSAFKI